MADICGIVLAAGAGRRAGGPKALLSTPEGTPWLRLATQMLLAAGCARVVVVLGAAEPDARALVPSDPRVSVTVAPDWADGMSASLRAGLAAASGDAALVTLVDLPTLPPSVALRVLAELAGLAGLEDAEELARTALLQATFEGRPGHPVLIGRDHWQAVCSTIAGDRGARDYLAAWGAVAVECSDLWDGTDRDLG